jgi:YggT family protein
MTITIGLLMRAADILFGTAGLLLILRILFQVFKMRWGHPIMKIVVSLTDPILALTDKLLGIPRYSTSWRSSGPSRSDMMRSSAALVALWTGRTLIAWVLQLFILVPGWLVQPLSSIGSIITYTLRLVFDLYGMALFVRVIFSWIRVPYTSRIARFLWSITEPLLAPIRAILPPLPGVDLSPLIAFFLLRMLQQIVFSMLTWIF